jgi:hypothetical protein
MTNEGQTGDAWDDEANRPGDAAMRQLRRRYESLRNDYEELLDRLADIEERMTEAQSPQPAAPPLQASELGQRVLELAAGPWFALREEYSRVARDLLALVGSMDDFANRSFKGQRPSRLSATEEAAPQETMPGPEAPEPGPPPASPGRSSAVHVQVQGPSLGALLDFQEQLSRLPGVARVSMSQVNEDRAMLIVELERESPGAES